MDQRLPRLAGLALALLAATLPASAAQSRWPSILDDDAPIPGLPDGADLPPALRHRFGLDAPPLRSPENNPGVTTPLVPAQPKRAETPPSPSRSRAEIFDDLFHRLAAAQDAEEAEGLALVIQHMWLQSGSDTADLLMARVGTAATKGDSELALKLLDKIVVLDPTWAEGWNKRATMRFLAGDDSGAMADIGRVLTLEPRHFGALSGMAAILVRNGMKKQGLSMLRDAAVIYPHNAEIDRLIKDLTPEVDGREI